MKNPIVDDIDALLKDLREAYGTVSRNAVTTFISGGLAGRAVAIRTEGGRTCLLSAIQKEMESLEATRNKLTGTI